MEPTFSVYIPAYNHAKYLGQTIESVLGQTCGDFELIIIDDCSTDNTKEVVYSFKDKRISYYYNEKNLGCVASNNKGISLSKGKYIYNLDSDDLMFPTNLEKKEKIFRKTPNIGLVYSDCNIIDHEGNILEESYWKSERYTPVRGRLNYQMIASCGLVMPTQATVFTREVVQKIGYQNTKLVHPHDGEYWLRIAGEFEVDYVPEVLCSWRIHQAGRHLTKDENMYIERASVIRDISAKYPWAISKNFKKICIANNFCQGGLLLAQKSDYRAARDFFMNALKDCPYHPLALIWYLNTYTKIETLWNIKAAKKYFLKFLRMLDKQERYF